MKKYLLIAILFSNLLSFSQNYSSQNTGDWSADGTWVGSAPGGTIQGEIIHINTDDIVTITSGGGVALKGSSELHIWGKLVVDGSFTLDASKIHVHTGGELQIIPDRDNGSVEVIFKNSSEIINDGTLSLDLGDMANLGGSTISNTGTLTIDDELNNAGGITNTGNFTVTGPVSNSGTIDNSGNFTAPSIDNTGSIINSGVIDADVTNNGGSYTGIFPLPIELTTFKAYKANNKVSIYWQTASEENNDFFSIERSVDGVNYYSIATVAGAGNSSSTIDYTYTDNSPLNGVAYYRLTQTDFNGKSETFDAVSLSFLNEEQFSFGPNPAKDNITISTSGEMADTDVSIYNIIGSLVKTAKMHSIVQSVDVSDLPTGTYMLIISANNNNISKRLVIQ